MLKNTLSFLVGFFVSLIGGLVGLGGAELRLPFLIQLFRFSPLQAVIINKTTSIIVVSMSLLARMHFIPLNKIYDNINIILNILIGSIIGSWLAADWATKIKSHTLQKIMGILLVLITIIFASERFSYVHIGIFINGISIYLIGITAGFLIGIISAILGVAGGELLIPTITILYHTDIKLAGSLSLVISLPTMLFAYIRYSKDKNFSILKENKTFILLMIIGSMLGSVIGGSVLLGLISQEYITIILILLLILSSYKLLIEKH